MTDGQFGRRHNALAAVAAVALVALCAAVASVPDEDASAPLRLGATENVAFDLGTTAGSRITSAELSGKPTILWFWAPWCPYSQDIAAEVAAEAKAAGDDVRFVGIGGQASARELRRFVSTYKVGGIEHGADLSGDVSDRFGVTSVPSFAVLYPEGGYEIQDWVSTGQDLHELVAELAR